jgi:hypothetical protein
MKATMIEDKQIDPGTVQQLPEAVQYSRSAAYRSVLFWKREFKFSQIFAASSPDGYRGDKVQLPARTFGWESAVVPRIP